jgi:hypothetical protein
MDLDRLQARKKVFKNVGETQRVISLLKQVVLAIEISQVGSQSGWFF